MLTLGANSTCDVCLEHFGTDNKAPYSIHCGHVFCFDCIRRVLPPECPLCRTPYIPGKWMKLHVDLLAPPLTGTEKEARRLQEAIGEVTTLGSSEPNLRQLINECRGFLQAQPRSMYADLRVAYRMLSYLCEVKTNLRAQNMAVESLKTEITQLTAEKEELENLQHLRGEVVQLAADKSELQSRLAASEVARDKDKQFATDLESRLNVYATRAESSYQALFQYHSIVQEYASLNDELKALRSTVFDHAKSVVQSSNFDVLPQLSSYGPDEEEYAHSSSPSPSSCISSLHELSDRSSPHFLGPFAIVPETKAEHKHEEVYSRRKLYRCDAEDQHVLSHCDVSSSSSSPSRRSTMPKPAFIIEHVGTTRRRNSISPPMTAPGRQNSLSRSLKNQDISQDSDRIRVRSSSDASSVSPPPPSGHQERPDDDDSQPSSESVSRSSSPEPIALKTARREASQNENVRRLYNILQRPLSSSPSEITVPNSTLKPRPNSSRSPSRSRSGSTASLQVAPGLVPPNNNYQQPGIPQPPSNVISRASDAAMAIEKSQKEKALKGREHRKLDKDSDRDRVRSESDHRTPKKQSSSTSDNYIQPPGSHNSAGLPGSPHRDTYIPTQPANNASQKIPGISAPGTLGRSNSIKVPSSQRDGSASHPPHPFRHGPGSNKTTSGAAPIAV